MIADEDKYGNIVGGEAVNASGEFPLLGLAGFASFIGITAEEDKVYAVFQGIVHHPVKGGQEVEEA